jgi:hypothetical protein
LVRLFGVDLLIPIDGTAVTQAFIDRHPHLAHNRWREAIFREGRCEFADIRHLLRRIHRDQDNQAKAHLSLPVWDHSDALNTLFSVMLGRYPEPGDQIADYRAAIRNEFNASEITITDTGEVPLELTDSIPPLSLTAYGMTGQRDPTRWLNPGIVLGSVRDFDDLTLFWNLRAAGAAVYFYDQAGSARLRSYTNRFLDKIRGRVRGTRGGVNLWFRREVTPKDDWQPDLDLSDIPVSVCRNDSDDIWNGLNVRPIRPKLSAWHRHVVPFYTEGDGEASASFALPDRPFDDDDIQSLSQKFVAVVDTSQHRPTGDLTFETPFVPEMNEFYGRYFYYDHDAARAQLGGLGRGAVGIITSISRQQLEVRAYNTDDWLTQFFSLCGLSSERSEPGLRCKRLINQFGGGLQDCRVLKIRGVRNLLRKYGVDKHFTRSGAIEAIRDVDAVTRAIGFDAFKHLHIEPRREGDLQPDHVLRYLVTRGVFRVGLEFTCPNCELPSWIHLDDVRTRSACFYCDHIYDVAPQLKDRDWRYRRSGIFGRDDNQLGGVPVALTLQQLDTSLSDRLIMYSSAMNFRSAGADIEPCESDFVAVVSGALGISESPVQILIGEAKTGKPIDEQDVRKLGKLAKAIPKRLAQCFIMFSKTDTFSSEEIACARILNTDYERRVILWSQDELEPYFLYERAKDRLGERRYATTLTDMADITHRLWFS